MQTVLCRSRGKIVLVANTKSLKNIPWLYNQPFPKYNAYYVEHYNKKQSIYIGEECRENEIRITSSGKPHDIATKLLHTLKEHPGRGVVVSGCGSHVTKAVTVAELLKKRQTNLKQHTEIKYVRVEDVWEPDQPDLDQLKVTRKIPAISITLVPSDRETGGERGRRAGGGKEQSTCH